MKPRERVAPLSESLAKCPIVTTVRTESEYGSGARGDGDRGGGFGLDGVPAAQSTDAHSPHVICDFLRHFLGGNRYSAA
jgi:hypothetical protein